MRGHHRGKTKLTHSLEQVSGTYEPLEGLTKPFKTFVICLKLIEVVTTNVTKHLLKYTVFRNQLEQK